MKSTTAPVPQIAGLIEEGEAFRQASPSLTEAPRRRVRRFHTGMALAFLVTAFVGFAPTYFLKSFTGAPPLSPLFHAHGVVFTSWLLLFLTQTSLVSARRVRLHMRLGIAGALLAVVMVPLGMMTAVESTRMALAVGRPDALRFMIFPFGQMVIFGGFMGAAIVLRERPELHRRLALLATVSLLPAAISRLPVIYHRPVAAVIVSTLFIVAAMIHDYRTRRRVHPMYAWGAAILLLSGPIRFGISHTGAWHALARFLVE